MSVVFITGGTGAIGEALISEFSASEDVAFSYFSNAEKAAELEKKFRCKGYQMNVCDSLSVNNAVNSVISEFGHIDILINNAGKALIKPFAELSEEDWKSVTECDLGGVFRVTKAAAGQMINRKSGSIINISSVWGVYGASCETAYSAAKAGVIGFTKALAKELGPSGITVNAIAPGVIESKMNACLSPEDIAALCDETPLGRLGKPEEVAKAARALCENKFITGQILGVDGGFY